MATTRPRLRELGITVGKLEPGPLNAITDVPGVAVGHATIIADHPHVLRTGVTVVMPEADPWSHEFFAGVHSFNGCGEFTGWIWLEESGCLTSPICLTSTYSVGAVRDALISIAGDRGHRRHWHLGLVGETHDGWLNDGYAMAVTRREVEAAIDAARSGPVAEGAVGGGTGMICHEFKGGIGTASRLVECGGGRLTLGVLVQANYGAREDLRVDGVPVGRAIGKDQVPSPRDKPLDAGGSILIVVATDAPLLPMQCRRLAQRAASGLGRTGGFGHNGSGDLFIAFSTGNRLETKGDDFLTHGPARPPIHVAMLPNGEMNPLMVATAEATEEAILNALCRAETMRGIDGRIAHALPLDRLQEIWRKERG
ncbi:MAG: P1 family peptidase [Proteobacteria bacterium]|nr:P1 family peptidase [Pseudomonadota bacterium]MBI3498089.1 P1 family peptidase [Pseudomonadota bacterium]